METCIIEQNISLQYSYNKVGLVIIEGAKFNIKLNFKNLSKTYKWKSNYFLIWNEIKFCDITIHKCCCTATNICEID